jgi:hypothetical protein
MSAFNGILETYVSRFFPFLKEMIFDAVNFEGIYTVLLMGKCKEGISTFLRVDSLYGRTIFISRYIRAFHGIYALAKKF